MISDRHTI